MNGPNHRDSTPVRAPVRIHPEEETNQHGGQEGTVAPITLPQQGVRHGQTALEDTLGEWLNGNHQTQIESVNTAMANCREELRVVYEAWQHEFARSMELSQSLQDARQAHQQTTNVVNMIFDQFPNVEEHFRLMSDESDISTIFDGEEQEVIDLTADSDSDDDMF